MVQVEDGSDEGVQAWREDICISTLKSVNKPENIAAISETGKNTNRISRLLCS